MNMQEYLSDRWTVRSVRIHEQVGRLLQGGGPSYEDLWDVYRTAAEIVEFIDTQVIWGLPSPPNSAR
jgi:hypothetical protein